MNHPTPPAAASDFALAQAFREAADRYKGSGHYDDFIYQVETAAAPQFPTPAASGVDVAIGRAFRNLLADPTHRWRKDNRCFIEAVEYQATQSAQPSGVAPDGKDWPEDFAHENGNYENVCHQCERHFYGHKRRITCKECAPPIAQQGGGEALELDYGTEAGESAGATACQIGDYGALEQREWATVLFNDRKIAECYHDEDAQLVADALNAYREAALASKADGGRYLTAEQVQAIKDAAYRDGYERRHLEVLGALA